MDRTYRTFTAATLIIAASSLVACKDQQAAPASLGAFSQEQICRAAISTIMSQPTTIITADRTENGVTFTSYVRSFDKTKWVNRCKLDGQRIIWASESGRWRTRKDDDIVRFNLEGNTLKIVEEFTDGSANSKDFSLERLQRSYKPSPAS